MGSFLRGALLKFWLILHQKEDAQTLHCNTGMKGSSYSDKNYHLLLKMISNSDPVSLRVLSVVF